MGFIEEVVIGINFKSLVVCFAFKFTNRSSYLSSRLLKTKGLVFLYIALMDGTELLKHVPFPVSCWIPTIERYMVFR